jgi:hypothetical protein
LARSAQYAGLLLLPQPVAAINATTVTASSESVAATRRRRGRLPA